MSCWLLAMVTHARLQSELQVRDPLGRSVSFMSFISCPLLLKQRKKKEKKKDWSGFEGEAAPCFCYKEGLLLG